MEAQGLEKGLKSVPTCEGEGESAGGSEGGGEGQDESGGGGERWPGPGLDRAMLPAALEWAS